MQHSLAMGGRFTCFSLKNVNVNVIKKSFKTKELAGKDCTDLVGTQWEQFGTQVRYVMTKQKIVIRLFLSYLKCKPTSRTQIVWLCKIFFFAQQYFCFYVWRLSFSYSHIARKCDQVRDEEKQRWHTIDYLIWNNPPTKDLMKKNQLINTIQNILLRRRNHSHSTILSQYCVTHGITSNIVHILVI